MSESVDRTLSHIHALVKHLLTVPEERASDIFIGVQPREPGQWRVQVSYNGFSQWVQEDKLDAALGKMLEHLTSIVAKHLEEGTELLSDIKT